MAATAPRCRFHVFHVFQRTRILARDLIKDTAVASHVAKYDWPCIGGVKNDKEELLPLLWYLAIDPIKTSIRSTESDCDHRYSLTVSVYCEIDSDVHTSFRPPLSLLSLQQFDQI